MYLCDVLSEKWWDAKKAFFCFILKSKSPISRRRISNNVNAHSVRICMYSTCYTFFAYTPQRGKIVSIFISARCLAIPDFDEWNSSYAFLMPVTLIKKEEAENPL